MFKRRLLSCIFHQKFDSKRSLGNGTVMWRLSGFEEDEKMRLSILRQLRPFLYIVDLAVRQFWTSRSPDAAVSDQPIDVEQARGGGVFSHEVWCVHPRESSF